MAVIAEVRLNSKKLGILWNAPYRVDATEALKQGQNELKVSVVNVWTNRIIGDQSLPADSELDAERAPDLALPNSSGIIKKWPQWVLDRRRAQPDVLRSPLLGNGKRTARLSSLACLVP